MGVAEGEREGEVGVEEREKGRGRGTTKMLPADAIYFLKLNGETELHEQHMPGIWSRDTHSTPFPLITRPSGQGQPAFAL